MKHAEIEDCKTWEEELYWKHFHEMQFYKILPNDFFHHLVLPSKFAKKMSDKLPKKLSLIGPSGSSWDVDISTTGDIAIVGDGWKDFAKTFNLEENYLLKFKYTQNLSFEVLIFDQKNMCEKEYSYFVKKRLPNPNDNVDRERSVDEAARTEILEDDIHGSGSDCVMSKKPEMMCSVSDDDDQGEKNIVEAPITTLAEFDLSGKTKADAIEVVSSDGRSNEADVADDTLDTQISILVAGLVATISKDKSTEKPSNKATRSWALSQHNVLQTPTGNGENKMHDALSAETLNGNGTPGTICPRNVIPKKRRSERAIPRSGKKLAFKIDTQRLSKEYMSQRRVVTDEEKEAALKRATEALTEGSFLVVMRPTSVYTNFYLSIPGDWINKNLPSRHHHQVILRIGEKTWMGMFHNNRRRGHSDGFASGWKNFTIENNLEDSDVCVFTPASQKGDAGLILDVKIFRVVAEITPLTPLLCSIV